MFSAGKDGKALVGGELFEVFSAGEVGKVLVGGEGEATVATALCGEFVETAKPLDDFGNKFNVAKALALSLSSFVALICLLRARGGLRLSDEVELPCDTLHPAELGGAFLLLVVLHPDRTAAILRRFRGPFVPVVTL